MTIKYENSDADIDAYARLLYAKSPTAKQHKSRSVNFAFTMIILLAVIIYFLDKPTTVFLWLVFSLLWIIYIPIQHRRKYVKNMIKEYRDDEHKNFFTTHQLEITNSGLDDIISIGKSHTNWDKIEHIEIIDSHSFIFVDSAMAFAIPKESITNGDYDKFVTNIKERISNENRSPQ